MNKAKFDLVGDLKKEKLLKMQFILDFQEIGQDIFSAVDLYEALSKDVKTTPVEFRELLRVAVVCELIELANNAPGVFKRCD